MNPVSPFPNINAYLPQDVRLFWSRVVKIVTSASAVIVGYVSFKYVWTIAYRSYKRYPNGPIPFLPIIGTAGHTFDPVFLTNSCGLYGAITLCQGFGKNMVLLNESKLVKQEIFNKPEFTSHFDFSRGMGPKMLPIFQEFDGGGFEDKSFVSLNGKKWKKRRQYASSVLIRQCDSKLTSEIINSAMKNVVFKELDQVCDQDGKFWYPKSIMSYLAFNTIYQANFGHSLKINDPKLLKLRDSIKERFSIIRKIRILLLFPFLIHIFQYFSIYSQVKENNRSRTQFFGEIFNQRRKYYQANPSKMKQIMEGKDICYVDYLLYLLDYSDENKDRSKINEIEAMNDISIMFGAGTDTTSTTLEYIIYFLMKRPDVQETVYNDLKQVTENNEDNYNVATFIKSNLFKAFIYECLRISCVAPLGISHTCDKDTAVTVETSVVNIPKNSMIMINIGYIHLSPLAQENWKNKECGLSMNDICLQNWLVDKKFKMNQSFIGFGTGKRDCVGQQMAMKEIYLVIGYLMLNYQFLPVDNDTSFQIERKVGLTTEIANEIPVVVRKRV